MADQTAAYGPSGGGWFAYIKPRRFQYLLGIFLAYALVTPLLGQDVFARSISAIISSIAMVQTCVSILPKRGVVLAGCSLAFLVSIYGSFVTVANYPPFNGVVCQASVKIISIMFYALAGRLIFLDVIRVGVVDVNKLCGSIVLYILIGVLWGQFYQLCDVLDPGCFLMDLSKLTRHGELNLYERGSLLNYFSFVTLSTLGYGDISPVTRITRTLSYSEAILGQLYIAVLVSRLVGLHIASTTTSADADIE
jgi:hypothetical protein